MAFYFNILSIRLYKGGIVLLKAVYEFFDYFEFLKELIKRDFKRKYYKSVLGILWTVLNPLLMMIVITIVFSTLFSRDIPNYPVYYLAGYIFINFNNATTSQSLSCILANSGLIKKIHLPKYMFVLSCVGVQFITLAISLIPLIIVMLVTGAPITWYMLFLPIPIFDVVLFTTGLSLILSIYGTFLRDLTHLYGIITMIWMYLTPMFYPIEIIPQSIRFLWNLNPMYLFISMSRSLVCDQTFPAEQTIIAAFLYAILILITGVYIFKKNQDKLFLYI